MLLNYFFILINFGLKIGVIRLMILILFQIIGLRHLTQYKIELFFHILGESGLVEKMQILFITISTLRALNIDFTIIVNVGKRKFLFWDYLFPRS